MSTFARKGHGRYVIALGSNVRVPRYGAPPGVLRAVVARIESAGVAVNVLSPIIASAPLGPSRRRYANAAAIITTDLDPPSLLRLLQQIEHQFGRIRRGTRWGARTLDLDIVLWSGGWWHNNTLTIPHREFRKRAFVLGPAAAIAPDWRDPVSGLTLKHLHTRLTRRTPVPR